VTEQDRAYIEALRNLWGPGYWVTWQPSLRLRLGEIGVTSHGQFVPTDHLEKLKIAFGVISGTSRDTLTYQSAGGVSVRFKGAGATASEFKAVLAADAGALVEFHKENGFLVSLDGLAESRIDSMSALAKGIVDRFLAGKWNKEWLVVSHLVTARSGTVLASSAPDSRVELKVSSGLGQGLMKVADLSANVSVASSNAVGLQITATELTPFFRTLAVREDWLRRVEVQVGAKQPFRVLLTDQLRDELIDEAGEEPDVVLADVDQGRS
jgi:hypothetical protein